MVAMAMLPGNLWRDVYGPDAWNGPVSGTMIDVIIVKEAGCLHKNGQCGGVWMYKNIEKQQGLRLKEQVDYQNGQVVSKTLVQNDYVSMTLFSFDKGEEISTHASGGDAMVTVLEGTGRFTVGGEVFILNEGETLIMPKGIPHAVYGEERFKMQLTVSF